MFKNAIIYKLAGAKLSAAALGEKLSANTFIACGPTQDKSVGWIPPRGEHQALVESIGGHLIAKLAIETKSVPKSEIDKQVQAVAEHIEQTTGRKPGKKERRDLQEEVRLNLLPKAFPKLKHVLVWINQSAGTIVINAGSQSAADDVISALLYSVNDLQVSLIQTVTSPQAAMTQWLLSDHIDMPGAFAIERECVLKSSGDDAATVKFNQHNLDNPDVRKHVTEGKLPTHLALSWDGKASFVLTETLQLKKIAFLGGVMDASGTDKSEDRFDADVALATGLLAPVVAELIDALGGEMQVAEGGEA